MAAALGGERATGKDSLLVARTSTPQLMLASRGLDMKSLVAALAAATLVLGAPAMADDAKMKFSGVHVGAGLQWFKQEGAVVNGEDTEIETDTVEACTSVFIFCLETTEYEVLSDIISEPFRINGNDEAGWAFLASLLALQQTGNFVVGAELCSRS